MDITNLNERFKNSSAQEILKYFLKEYGDKAALSSSFGAEDQVITDMLLRLEKKQIYLHLIQRGFIHKHIVLWMLLT